MYPSIIYVNSRTCSIRSFSFLYYAALYLFISKCQPCSSAKMFNILDKLFLNYIARLCIQLSNIIQLKILKW
jgi:hypothetical protein